MRRTILCDTQYVNVSADGEDEKLIRDYQEICSVWPAAPLPTDCRKPMRSAPTLLISGEHDPSTPTSFGESAASRSMRRDLISYTIYFVFRAMPIEQMTRNVLAQRAGIRPETIRYYERIGLVEEPRKNRSGHRVYEPADLTRLVFIRRAQELGFSLEDIRELLALRLKEVAQCSHVERRATRRLVDVRKRIRELEGVEQGLRDLIASCRENPYKASCPVFEVLEGADESIAYGPNRR